MKINHAVKHVAISCLLLAGTAYGSLSVTVTLDSIYGNATSGTLNGSSFGNINSGVMQFDQFNAFCCDPNRVIPFGQTLTYQIESASTLPNADTIACIVSEYDASNLTTLDASASQWAIWKVIVDGANSSFSSGNVMISGNDALAALATQYIASAGNYSPAPIVLYANGEYQNQIGESAQLYAELNPAVVPEPATSVFAPLASFLLFMRKRKTATI